MFNVLFMCNECVNIKTNKKNFLLQNAAKGLLGKYLFCGGCIKGFQEKTVTASVGGCCCIVSYAKIRGIIFKHGYCRNRG